ncbi:TetR/AcrR family transcriptional regulator [Rhodococcus koreensis]
MTTSKTLTPRGQRTRQNLLDAATTVFAREGYLESKITDFTTEAGQAKGTFYTYFDSKEQIFLEVVGRANSRMHEALKMGLGPGATPFERIENATRRYVQAYRADAAIMTLLEQVASTSPEFREIRLKTRRMYRARTEKAIRTWQEEGIVDKTLPPDYAAEALISMVSNFCYMWLAMNDEHDEELVIYTLSRMWARALGLPVD